MVKIAANIKFCAYRTERKLRSKDRIAEKDVKWFQNNIPTIMARSTPARIEHVKAVVEFYEFLDSKNFNPFYASLPDKFKQAKENENLQAALKELSDINESLSREEKNILKIALCLHDIGITPEVRNWDHHIAGEKRARKLLLKMNFPEEIVDGVAMIVRNHGGFSNIGVDTFPVELTYFPGLHVNKFLAMRKQLLIMAALDSSGKPNFSNLTSNGLRDLLDFYLNKHEAKELFWKYRLRTFFMPIVFSHVYGPRMQDQEVGVFKLDEIARKVLDKKLKIHNFSLFQLLSKNDNTYQRPVKLMKLISYITEIASKEEYFIFDTDVDFFAYEMKDRAPFVKKVESYLDKMPDDFNLETVRDELNATENKSCFGMPIDLTPQKLTVKISLSPRERD